LTQVNSETSNVFSCCLKTGSNFSAMMIGAHRQLLPNEHRYIPEVSKSQQSVVIAS